MALMKLDAGKFQESIGSIKQVVNTEILETMQLVAQALQNTGDTNKIVDDQLENCKKFQTHYNTTLDGVKSFMGELGKVYDIAEFMDKKANIGEVKSRDTGFGVNAIATDKFKI